MSINVNNSTIDIALQIIIYQSVLSLHVIASY